jgi:hypothetical protein
MSSSSRTLGNNYALAWKTGAEIHMTLVYINNVKRGYEQERVKELVNDFMEATQVPVEFPLPLGDMISTRCVSVDSSELEMLRQCIYEHLLAQGFDMRPLKPLHIHLRGGSAVDSTVQIRSWNW